MRRTLTTALVGILLVSLTVGCGVAGSCNKKGGNSILRVQVPAAIQKLVKTFRVELCQGKRCEAINFASRPTKPNGYISKGVDLEGDAYSVDVGHLGTHWKADSATGLTLIGLTRSGESLLRHTEQFEFAGYYPNGEDCDEYPSVSYSTSVGGEDLVG